MGIGSNKLIPFSTKSLFTSIIFELGSLCGFLISLFTLLPGSSFSSCFMFLFSSLFNPHLILMWVVV